MVLITVVAPGLKWEIGMEHLVRVFAVMYGVLCAMDVYSGGVVCERVIDCVW